MEDTRIKELFLRALNDLIRKDIWLLQHNLNERCITHKLGEYLQPIFLNYNVDCEYNGDVEREGLLKRICILQENVNQNVENVRDVSVFPDIIIHRRGFNQNNLCIVEVKKSAGGGDLEFDRDKLKAYTSTEDGNNLGYQLGIFVILQTNVENPTYELEYFKNGNVHNL